ncbi:hypothetical protein [Gilvimarinus polysaccharolyticus]|uniref:hypothetical protein n=1 Tax=Gilvimarinus polysaccharolyticus TaxID=863921 RepID=UPI0006730C04|nr:hypothetical protein [Gilvimarinus polysaccharolyticus]
MKLVLKIAIGVVLTLLAIPAIFLGVVFWFGGDMCGNYVHKEYLSPSNSHKAVIFQRDCGATAGFSTQISIIGAREDLSNSKGNIYIIDGHPDEVAPTLKWLSESILSISRPLNGTEYKAKHNWGWLNRIEVEYGAGSS